MKVYGILAGPGIALSSGPFFTKREDAERARDEMEKDAGPEYTDNDWHDWTCYVFEMDVHETFLDWFDSWGGYRSNS